MRQIPNYADERTLAFCPFCGGGTGTRDHCPSRVFLDEPYPENLPVVPACERCNGGFSEDEGYVACLLACVVAGSTDPREIQREKISRILAAKPALRARLERTRTREGLTTFHPEHDRIRNVVRKLARGHALYELHECCAAEPDYLHYTHLSLLDQDQRAAFAAPASASVWPEVGSRAMQRMLVGDLAESDIGWLQVQGGRYRHMASLTDGFEIRVVIGEYLACHVVWDFERDTSRRRSHVSKNGGESHGKHGTLPEGSNPHA